MTALPPKPASPPPLPLEKDDDDRRRHKGSPSSRRISQDDKAYVPSRSGRPTDSYLTPHDRGRDEDRYTGRYRDRDWDRRDRDTREYDRDHYRRREDTYYARDDRRSHRPPSPRRSDRSYRSRSPRGRRPYSPPRYARFRHSKSPPPRRPRYSSRSRSRSPHSPRRRRSRSRTRTPQKRKREHSPESTYHRGDHPQFNAASLGSSVFTEKRKANRSRSRSIDRRATDDRRAEPMSLSTDILKQKLPEPSTSQPRPNVQSSPDKVSKAKYPPAGDRHLEPKSPRAQSASESVKDDVRVGQDNELKTRERTPSPPRQPRYMANQSMRDGSGSYARHNSRSPPRGPRTFARSSLAQSAANSRAPPVAPRGYDVTITDSKKTNKSERSSVTAALDVEIARLESHRANLATEYVQLAKNARRALHELDMAMLDLRAAEVRRKATSNQLEKARAGMLGIDAVVAVGSPVI